MRGLKLDSDPVRAKETSSGSIDPPLSADVIVIDDVEIRAHSEGKKIRNVEMLRFKGLWIRFATPIR
ncbi:hypothetical protein V1477_010195 [Vespula maculifrons]|uniref:Uncharacterized protein n=1 Tax=Vespula maculifrons TaxID=7453 RepID=A0ABD2C8Q2_VESMC